MALTVDGVPVTARRLTLERPARVLLRTDGGRVPAIPGMVAGVQVDVALGGRPPEAELACLAGFSRRIGTAPVAYAEVAQVALFFHDGLWRNLQPDDLDAEIVRVLGPLHRVASRPRSRLREDEAVVPVERIRRVARGADRHLARNGRFIFGGLTSRPTHLLSRLLEDDFVLLENRAVVTLCRALRDRARRRLDRLNLALDQLIELGAELTQLEEAGARKRAGQWRKLAGLDGKDGRLGELEAAAETYRRALRHQLEACAAVLDGPLGQALRDAPPVRGALPDTNIFAHDENYAAISRLWRFWPPGSASSVVLDPLHDDPDRAYTRFLRLLVGQALHRLGFEGTGPLPLLDEDPVLELKDAEGWSVDLSPIPSGIRLAWRHVDPEAEKRDREVGRYQKQPETLDVIGHFDPCGRLDVPASAIWLHPVTRLERNQDPPTYRALRSTGLAPIWPQGPVPPSALPAAPWYFGSADGLARMLRGRFLGLALREGRVPARCPICAAQTRQGAQPTIETVLGARRSTADGSAGPAAPGFPNCCPVTCLASS